jgi:hypothetical protein
MELTDGIRLARGGVEARVIPAEGGVLAELRVGGRDVLATTPWARDRAHPPTPALSEGEWVDRWRGGWQLCFPSAGEPDPGSPWPQGFHGVASQAPWTIASATPDAIKLEWGDDHGLTATRTWRLTDSGARVETVARNAGTASRPLVIAEHLILGGDVLAPIVRDDAALTITPPDATVLAPLDYEGRPDGERLPWPGSAADRWPRVDRETPARVVALVGVGPPGIRVVGPHVTASVTWQGLDHALVWEELARSSEPPWSSAVVALGIEPTSAPHGRGTAIAEGAVVLDPGRSLTWSTELAIDWLAADVLVPPAPTKETP